MPRPKPKVPFAFVADAPDLNLSSDDRSRIRGTYTADISDNLWVRIEAATREFLADATCEIAAQDAKPARRRLHLLRANFEEMLGEIDQRNAFAEGAPEFYADYLIWVQRRHPESKPSDLRPSERRQLLRPMADEMNAWLAACERAEREMRNTHYWVPGYAWRAWINELAAGLTEAGLHVGTRETVGRKGRQSYPQFVRFVRELQSCIPDEYRRGTTSDANLAQAIKRALKREATAAGGGQPRVEAGS